MIVYVLLAFLIIFSYPILSNKKNGILHYCCIICCAMCLIAGLRNENLGLTDTLEVYKVFFYRILNNDYSYVLQLKDLGFQTATFVFTRIFGDNFKLYVFLFTIPYILAVTFIIYKFSNNKPLSFIVFMCLHYFEISFTLMRQINGMAFLIIGLYFFVKKRYVKFIVSVLIGSLFHQICIIFILLYLFRFIQFKKWMILVVITFLFFTLAMPEEIMKIAYNFIINNDRFSRYESVGQEKNLMLFLINFIMWIVELIYILKSKTTRLNNILFICSSICLIVSPLTISLGEMSRVAYIFGITNIILLPNSVTIFDSDSKRIINISFATVFFIYFFMFLGPQVNIIPYYL